MKKYFGLAVTILASAVLSTMAQADAGHHSGGFHGGSFGASHGGFDHHHFGHSVFFFGVPWFGAAYYGSPYYYGGYGYGAPYYGYGAPYYGYGRGYYAGTYHGRAVQQGRQSIGAAVQAALAREGYYHGRIDGVIGEQSRLAIRNYQRRNGLPITGRLDNSLIDSLGV